MTILHMWLAQGAFVALSALDANAIAYRRRHGTWLKEEVRAAARTQRLGRYDIACCLAFVCALVAGFGTPYVSPQSSFAQWLAEPFSLTIYVAWCAVIAIAMCVVGKTLSARAAKTARLR